MSVTVAVAGLKGGVAKTTTAVYFAQAAAESEGSALLVDADPQGSALAWYDEANESGRPLDADAVAMPYWREFETRLAPLAAPYPVVVIDTPPTDGHRQPPRVRAALSAADVAVLPMTPTPLEVERLHPTLELAADVGTPAVVLIVRARRTRSLAAALDGLAAADLPMLEPPIPLREAIAASYGARPRNLWGYDQALAALLDAVT